MDHLEASNCFEYMIKTERTTKMGMKRKNVESDDGKEKRGAVKKKKLATPKGQKKLTSFFTK